MSMTSWERLSRRVGTMHLLWNKATTDLTTEQINFRERAGVLPIAFSLLHYVVGEDRNVSTYLSDTPLVWESGDWGAKIGGNIPDVRRGTPVEIAEEASLGDAAIWMAYQADVFARTENALAAAGPESYDKVVIESIPAEMAGSFIGMTYGPGGPVVLGDILDGFVFQHGIRHLGEIEHARSLLGLQGVS